MDKTIVVFSGGMDSATLLHQLVRAGENVTALTVNYGQRHAIEIAQARAFTTWLDVDHQVISLPLRKLVPHESALTDENLTMPSGHYTDESMKSTVVPGRNLLLLSLALGHAAGIRARAVAYGAHAGDHAIYPDCRPEFVKAVRCLGQYFDWHPVDLKTPFLEMSKTDICRLGIRLGTNYGLTWTCYDPQPSGQTMVGMFGFDKLTPCGQCGACNERTEAFQDCQARDPLAYALVPTREG